MKADSPPERRKVWRVPGLPGLELLRAAHLKQVFPRHTHEDYAFGVVEGGALGFFYRGEHVVASSGHVNLCVPGEAHTGQPALPGGWSYRMFYLDARTVQEAAAEFSGRPQGLPYFGPGVLADAPLSRRLRGVHGRLEEPDATLLERQTLVLETLAQLIRRHAERPPAPLRAAREPWAVGEVRDYLEARYAEEVSLERLSELVGLSRFHLVRVFCKAVGVPPHSYLRQVRVARAKALLAAGETVAGAAFAVGFADQSHLTRWFKRFWGFTPGEYRKGVQDGAERTV